MTERRARALVIASLVMLAALVAALYAWGVRL